MKMMFLLQVHFLANQTRFHLNGLARRSVLNRRQRVTRKWPMHILILQDVKSVRNLVSFFSILACHMWQTRYET